MKLNLKHSQPNLSQSDKLRLPSKSFEYLQQKEMQVFRKNSHHLNRQVQKSKQKKNSFDKVAPIRKNKSMKIVTEILNEGKTSTPQLAFGWNQIDKIQYQLAIEKRLRQSLERENQTLKKQIAFLNNFGTSMRASVNNKKATQEEMSTSNKQKILSRLNRKRQGVLPQKDNDSTGLFSAKTKRVEEKISDMYDDYARKRIVPMLENVYEAAQNYFDQFRQNYSKLFIMFNQRKEKEKEKSQVYRKLQNLLFLFQVPILYHKKPKQLMRSVSRERLISSKISSLQNSFHGKQTEPCEKDIPQYKSNEQIVEGLVSYLKLVLKSKRMMALFIKTQSFGEMLKRIKQMN